MPVYDPANEFARSLAKVLVHEGGYSNHPKDPGGATMRGVTQRVYDEYRRSLGLQLMTVKNISDSELQAIYRKKYWNEIKGDKLAPGISYVVFDGAVNSGVAQSVKWLQRALQAMGLYQGGIDGNLGQGTLLALSGVNDNDSLICRILDRRMAFLRALKTWKTFGKGWTARVNGVRAVGQAWASGSVGPEVQYIVGGDAKAFLSDAKAAPTLAVADATTGGGIGSGGLAGTLQQVQDQLSPLSYSSELIGKVVAGLIVVGAVLTIGGLGYRWYANRRKAERLDALDLQVKTDAQAAA
ncbi:Lysozyme family protein [Rhizobium mongolense subsp. loessense]|uniref:Lysozyme family protein n=1 Tax=Rhizobium mongolense subsp. loessense TaxID=158890 RepID=A0A1G4Q2Z3_9HYPH|nr:glycoside hydrolase family 108 protein [Rhizobium mongolense]SCW38970.1 Lysozyme family protein [Rhizobium mongolense subsp. loessense]